MIPFGKLEEKTYSGEVKLDGKTKMAWSPKD
jgi:hypothetical protein